MFGRPEQPSRSLGDQDPLLDEILTPDIREALASLALMSENHLDIADAVAEHTPMLACLLNRHPQFAGSCRGMLIRLAQLYALHGELADLVMRHSRLFEDAIVAAGVQSRKRTAYSEGNR
ncbi:MAG: hypothetical protein ACE5HE_12040 [Phycisphaerae bacterium]